MDCITIITEFVNATLNLFLAFWLFSSLWDIKYPIKVTVPAFIAVSVLYTVPLLFVKGTVWHYVANILFVILVAYLFNSRLFQKIIFCFIFHVVSGAIEIVVALGLTSIFSLDYEAGKVGALYVTGLLLSKFFVFVFITIIRLKRKEQLLRIVKKNFISVLVFPMATFAVLILQHILFINANVEDRVYIVAILICYTLLIGSNVLIFAFMDTLYKNTITEGHLLAVKDIIENQSEQYLSLINHHRDVIQIRHDHKHFCIGLLNELKEGKYQTVISALEREYETLTKYKERSNDIIHSIVEIKTELASQHHIVVDFEYRELEKTNLSAIDLAIILGNALDNAIDATQKVTPVEKRIIRVLVAVKNSSIILSIANPVVAHVDVENLVTGKRNAKFHGFGTISMRQLVNKYNGELDFSCSNNEFVTSIILPNFHSKCNE